MDKREKLILAIMAEAEEDGEPVTRAEAEEMADMELGAKEIKVYEQAETPKKRKAKERKVDEEKKGILSSVEELMKELGGENLSLKTETELSFTYNGSEYSLKLIKHRPPKK